MKESEETKKSKFIKYNNKVQPYTIRLNKEDESLNDIRKFLDDKRNKKELSKYLLKLVAEDMKKSNL